MQLVATQVVLMIRITRTAVHRIQVYNYTIYTQQLKIRNKINTIDIVNFAAVTLINAFT